MEEEKKFFNFCSDTLKKYDNLKTKFKQIDSTYRRPSENYNPLKYVRGSKLIDESFINSNFPELDFSQDLKEWKDKEKNGKKGVLTYEEYLKKAKDQRLSAGGAQPNSNMNVVNQGGNLATDFSKLPNQNKSGSNKFSYDDYKKQKSLNAHSNYDNQPAASYSPNVNFNANNDLDFSKINNNFSFNNKANNKFEPLNFNVPDNSGAAELNPYENISLDNLNLNSNNPYNQQAINYNNNNMGNNTNYGFGHSNFPINNNNNYNNQGFPQNNVMNPNNNNNNKNNKNNSNNDFFNINNLDFPK